MISVYLAAHFERQRTLQGVRQVLERHGIRVTSRWLDSVQSIFAPGVTDPDRARLCAEDLHDIRSAAVFVLFNPLTGHRSGTGGRHVELGYALAIGKPVLLMGQRENVFHWHPSVEVLDDDCSLLDAIRTAATHGTPFPRAS